MSATGRRPSPAAGSQLPRHYPTSLNLTTFPTRSLPAGTSIRSEWDVVVATVE